MSLISDIVWIKRGVPKAQPDKVRLTANEISELLKAKCRSNPLAGIAMFASPMEDPHVTTQVDSDEEEREDFQVKPDDNFVVVGKIFKNEYTLEVYLYNEANDDWYVHHDYILDIPPLCLEPVYFDFGSEDKKGNLLAVGGMDASINVWDLDLVNSVEPLFTLGGVKKTNRKRQKRDGSAQGHSDAVLSLSWNHLTEHVLASGSADNTVILWDLEETKPATVLTDFNGKVQSVMWHPVESPILLTGTLSGQVGIIDCRNCDTLSKQWDINGEVERLAWNRFCPFYFFVVTDNGHLFYVDTRANGSVFSKKIHEGSAHSIEQSCYTTGLLSTSGEDELLKIWRLKDDGTDVELIIERKMGLGNLHVCRFSPDSGAVLVLGGEKEEMVKVIDVSKFEEVQTAFS
ncbi:unnamed protein product [Thelazia callipaeda]|uniref:WD_REPEATS_REGION domain-containing protein n=1 Tax=Thelazia callipaeda TaxID=103827 RepID=A0A0N5CLQ2_THECL|nr:unnamed protein product [Thelazia callipaeda]